MATELQQGAVVDGFRVETVIGQGATGTLTRRSALGWSAFVTAVGT
jgi:hypothetical protein